ncbi:Lrp/AsnC family transcriptional regulator [Klebsiella michiganensis]|jgi:Lrp/AsnC family transcriptional regulator|uniref:Lrp/AsnC family transcriptional regulator n=1 Tax=Klebsiella michiganensis TaxID=1134687 RepID=UPI0025706D96|nr:Lrp/AsnC family transcriptional regulator [Klebsiella michiganensis]MDL4455003.1 Lrp/AsnC family transcriptional regulator [Klebsiella michiganensis]
MDNRDRQILQALQADSSQSLQALAEQVGLTHNPCWRRVNRLEDAGIIRGYGARLDREKLGLEVVAFLQVKSAVQTPAWHREFMQKLQAEQAVTGIYRTAGKFDYLLQVMTPTMRHYDGVYRQLLMETAGVGQVVTWFVMEEVRPIGFVPLAS